MIGASYRLVQFPDEIRKANNFSSKARLDCISFTDQMPGGYQGLTIFVNSKGQLFFYKTPCRDFINTDCKRLAEWGLTNNGLNLSSIYIEDMDCPEIGYGYPNAKRLLKNGSPNPLFPYRNDGYLFLMNRDLSEIELFVIPDGRNLISSYYQKMIDGGFDEQIGEMRKQAKPFYRYEGIAL
jgi:hypothetical protein